MSQYKYSFKNYDAEKMARAAGRDITVSFKTAIEIANFLRGKKVESAKRILEAVKEKKQAIPYKRFTNGVGHRSGKMAAGRYPLSASTKLLEILKSAESNAQDKGLGKNLKIIHMSAQKGAKQLSYGRMRRAIKRCHVEIVLQEAEPDKKTESEKTSASPKKKEVAAKKKETTDKATVVDKPVEKQSSSSQEKKPEAKKTNASEKNKDEQK